MISLVNMGVLDASFLTNLQVFQCWLSTLLKATWAVGHAPRRLAWDDELNTFRPYYDMVEGIANV